MATSTSHSSPGVVMSWSEMWTWKLETPMTVPAGARISAGKSGSVLRSLPKAALTVVKRSPVSCMPSPESPANRMTTRSMSSAGRARWCGSVGHRSSPFADREQVVAMTLPPGEPENRRDGLVRPR